MMMTIFVVIVAIVGSLYYHMRGLSPHELTARVQGKRVVVTGASLGIGREIVKQYVQLDVADIVLVARSVDKLESLRDEVYESFGSVLEEEGGKGREGKMPRIHIIPADLSGEEVCKGVIDQAVAVMGGIDYLVLNHITNSQYGLWTGVCVVLV